MVQFLCDRKGQKGTLAGKGQKLVYFLIHYFNNHTWSTCFSFATVIFWFQIHIHCHSRRDHCQVLHWSSSQSSLIYNHRRTEQPSPLHEINLKYDKAYLFWQLCSIFIQSEINGSLYSIITSNWRRKNQASSFASISSIAIISFKLLRRFFGIFGNLFKVLFPCEHEHTLKYYPYYMQVLQSI